MFVLSKEVSAKARLLEALASQRRDDDLIEQLAAEVQVGGGGVGAGGNMLGLVWQRFDEHNGDAMFLHICMLRL